jgi:hypothetical protein
LTIAPDLLEFIHENIRSMWTLELLLLLKRDAGRSWRPEDLVLELRGSRLLVSHGLAALQRAGVTDTNERGEWSYSAPGERLPSLCDRLEDAYRERPVTITNIVGNTPPAVQSLADAFNLRRPK